MTTKHTRLEQQDKWPSKWMKDLVLQRENATIAARRDFLLQIVRQERVAKKAKLQNGLNLGTLILPSKLKNQTLNLQ